MCLTRENDLKHRKNYNIYIYLRFSDYFEMETTFDFSWKKILIWIMIISMHFKMIFARWKGGYYIFSDKLIPG